MAEPPRLDPDEVLGQAAALAAHLQRSGLRWLPRADPAGVDRVAPQLAGGGDEFEPSDGGRAAGALVPRTGAVVPRTGAGEPSPQIAVDRSSVPAASLPKIDQGDPLAAHEREPALSRIEAEVRGCQRCPELARCRQNTVFGEGNASARFVFFGEGPGADEDRQGRPFVGRAGQLLTKMIEACKLRREEVYIMNTVKCRPPGNRNPEPLELENCREYYTRQLEIIRPEYIVCLGAISSQELLQNKLSVGRMRGQFHSYFSSKVLVTYHPAYLLRNPSAKRAAWQDLQLMMRDAGLT